MASRWRSWWWWTSSRVLEWFGSPVLSFGSKKWRKRILSCAKWIFPNSILSVPCFTHLLSFASLFKNLLDSTIGKNFTHNIRKGRKLRLLGFFEPSAFLRCGKSSPTLVSDFVEAAWQNDNLSVGEWLLGPCEPRLESGKEDRPWTLMNLGRPCSWSTRVGLRVTSSISASTFKRFLMN